MDNGVDREALAERNRRLSALRHKTSQRERIRRTLLRWSTIVPLRRAPAPEPGTFLLIRPDHLGDVLLTMPAIQALKRVQPESRLIGLCGAWGAEVMAAYDEVEITLTLPFPGFARGSVKGGLIRPYLMAWQAAQQVRKLRVETALILRSDHWWGALVTKLARIPNRIGSDHPDLKPFVTQAVSLEGHHAVVQSLKLVESLTGPIKPHTVRLTYPIQDADREQVKRILSEHLTPRQRYLVIHPGAGTPIKQWGAKNWALVADRLAHKLDAVVAFTGVESEYRQVFPILKAMKAPAIPLLGEFSIGQLAALYEKAVVVLGPDTGPLHLATASGAPTVHLFGPADPAQFGAWGSPSRQVMVTSSIGCRPCRVLDWSGDDPDNHPCIRDIAPLRVVEAAVKAAQSNER